MYSDLLTTDVLSLYDFSVKTCVNCSDYKQLRMIVKRNKIYLEQITCQFWLNAADKIRLNWTVMIGKMIQHTYIIGHYNPSVRIIDLVSRTTYIVC